MFGIIIAVSVRIFVFAVRVAIRLVWAAGCGIVIVAAAIGRGVSELARRGRRNLDEEALGEGRTLTA